jgi:two-component system sensor histidine kinase FlrB
MSQTATARQELQNAFEQFDQESAELTGSWRRLQRQVLDLGRALSVAHTERQQLLDEIQRLRQENSRTRQLSSMGEMTARLAHQIRTPLATALLYASQLKQVHIHQRQHNCFVDRLLVGLRHLDHMVNDMLLFARGGRTDKQPVSVAALLTQVRDALLPQLQRAQAEWIVPVEAEPLVVCGQQDLLSSVLSNLVSNALQATDGDARLEWQAGMHGGEIELSLQDNGPGIPEALQQRIFEPFFTTRSSGTGLGLAVVSAVIVAHNGFIELDKNYTDGARFVIRLPAFNPAVQDPGEAQLPSGQQVTRGCE